MYNIQRERESERQRERERGRESMRDSESDTERGSDGQQKQAERLPACLQVVCQVAVCLQEPRGVAQGFEMLEGGRVCKSVLSSRIPTAPIDTIRKLIHKLEPMRAEWMQLAF